MAPVFREGELVMLEDFIRLAKEGKDVQVKVDLRKETISQKVHPGHTADKRGEVDAYLLIGDYTCRVAGEVHQVPKVYVFGSGEEPLDTARIHKHMANERLRRDYNRLKAAKIKIEEKYF